MSLEESLMVRWNAVRDDVPFNPASGFARWFVEHPEIGSPLEGERGLDDGGTSQSFTGGVLHWHPDTGVEVVTDPSVLDQGEPGG